MMSAPKSLTGPSEALRPVGRDVFRRGVQSVGHRAVPGRRPEAGPEIVGAPAK